MFLSWKLDKFTLFTHSLVGWNLENLYKRAVPIFLRLSWRFKREKTFFWKESLLQNECLYQAMQTQEKSFPVA